MKTTEDFIENTITVNKLIYCLERLKGVGFGDFKVFISSDSEGNSYGTLDQESLWSISQKDKSVALMQFAEHLTDEQIMPQLMEQIDNELEAEWEAKNS